MEITGFAGASRLSTAFRMGKGHYGSFSMGLAAARCQLTLSNHVLVSGTTLGTPKRGEGGE